MKNKRSFTRQTKSGRTHACACAPHCQGGYTATWRMNRTLPVPARAQLRTFFVTFGVTSRAPDNCICPLGKMYYFRLYLEHKMRGWRKVLHTRWLRIRYCLLCCTDKQHKKFSHFNNKVRIQAITSAVRGQVQHPFATMSTEYIVLVMLYLINKQSYRCALTTNITYFQSTTTSMSTYFSFIKIVAKNYRQNHNLKVTLLKTNNIKFLIIYKKHNYNLSKF